MPTAATPPPPAPRRLLRQDKQISGVAGGLAAYFNLDPTLVRLGIVVASVLSGFTLPIAYLVGWAIIPERTPDSGTQSFNNSVTPSDFDRS